MKNLIKTKGWAAGALFLLVTLSVGGGALAAVGVSGTKHDLSSATSGTNTYYSNTTEICVFCHTPHNANETPNTPLWNRALSGETYTTYSNANSLDAVPDALSITVTAGVAAAASVSNLCLSCHDGTLALNSLLNYPGSTTSVTMTGGNFITGARNLGTNLSNDHPVNFVYNDALVTADTATGGAVAGLKDPDTLTNVRLFGASGSATVQCASCHNPHDATNTSFLRDTMAGSALCLNCHIK